MAFLLFPLAIMPQVSDDGYMSEDPKCDRFTPLTDPVFLACLKGVFEVMETPDQTSFMFIVIQMWLRARPRSKDELAMLRDLLNEKIR